MPKLVKPEKISLLNHPEIKETWIQKKIAEDPSILGLGNLVLRDRERKQPYAGRLDLLLQEEDGDRRYEVEIQLGKTDESHIIRTIEYWDIERKRYTKYEHFAVIIAEEITSRFLNVISLFHGSIPLIALQMNAFKCGEDVALVFTTVLDETKLNGDDEEEAEPTDRQYWLKKASEETVKMADTLLSQINKKYKTGLELKYNKFYIGLAEGGNPNNFILFKPRKGSLNVEFSIPYSDQIQKEIEKKNIDDVGYQRRWERYRLRLTKKDLVAHKEFIEKMVDLSRENYK